MKKKDDTREISDLEKRCYGYGVPLFRTSNNTCASTLCYDLLSTYKHLWFKKCSYMSHPIITEVDNNSIVYLCSCHHPN